MTRIAKKVLRNLRKTRKPPKIDTSRDWLAKIKGKQNLHATWEQDKKIKRDANFQKLLIGQAKHRAKINAEKERQEEINVVRLKNLKKARKAKEKRNG